jgi:hypothetical protein
MKKVFLLSVVCLIGSYAWALTSITTGKVTGSPFCGGTSVNVPYTVNSPANPGNVFTAQLSDLNGSFASPVNIGTLAATGSGAISATIPLGTPTGTMYRIRVVSSNPVVIGSTNTKNLAINPKPGGVNVTAITACSETLNWNAVSSASSYKVRYKKHSDALYGPSINAASTTYTFNGLSPNTSYDFQVRAVCANGQLSDWKKITSSTIACPVPTGGTVIALTPTTATLDWNDMVCATGYRIRYKQLDQDEWTHYVTSTASTKVLTGLLPATDYEAQVATLCGTDSSAYSASIQWQTTYRLSVSDNATGVYNVFPNPSNGEFSLNFTATADNTPVLITIQNVYGQTVFSGSRTYHQGLNEDKITIPNANGGMYLIKVKSGDQTFESSMMVK